MSHGKTLIWLAISNVYLSATISCTSVRWHSHLYLSFTPVPVMAILTLQSRAKAVYACLSACHAEVESRVSTIWHQAIDAPVSEHTRLAEAAAP